jgi:hypothetical protein
MTVFKDPEKQKPQQEEKEQSLAAWQLKNK